MPDLILIRGLPGSGKSTVASKMVRDRTLIPIDWWEADQFFEDGNGGYEFEPRLLRQAHDWCYTNTLKSLRDGVDTIVSNTFTQAWEMEKYLGIGEWVQNLNIRIIEVKTSFESVHGVPAEKLRQMAARWESLPEDIVEEVGATVEVILPDVLDAYNEERLVSRFDKGALE